MSVNPYDHTMKSELPSCVKLPVFQKIARLHSCRAVLNADACWTLYETELDAHEENVKRGKIGKTQDDDHNSQRANKGKDGFG